MIPKQQLAPSLLLSGWSDVAGLFRCKASDHRAADRIMLRNLDSLVVQACGI